MENWAVQRVLETLPEAGGRCPHPSPTGEHKDIQDDALTLA